MSEDYVEQTNAYIAIGKAVCDLVDALSLAGTPLAMPADPALMVMAATAAQVQDLREAAGEQTPSVEVVDVGGRDQVVVHTPEPEPQEASEHSTATFRNRALALSKAGQRDEAFACITALGGRTLSDIKPEQFEELDEAFKKLEVASEA